ncbi:MAG: hypothetical protein GXW97_07865 [Methanothermobacter sp.]|jgi:hypothetical protein|nr:hypothetical protein [Methanothermobacter sp.]
MISGIFAEVPDDPRVHKFPLEQCSILRDHSTGILILPLISMTENMKVMGRSFSSVISSTASRDNTPIRTPAHIVSAMINGIVPALTQHARFRIILDINTLK